MAISWHAQAAVQKGQNTWLLINPITTFSQQQQQLKIAKKKHEQTKNDLIVMRFCCCCFCFRCCCCCACHCFQCTPWSFPHLYGVCVCVCAGKENIACTTGTACRLPHTTTRRTTTTALLYNKAQHASDTQTDRDGQRDRQRRTEGQRDKRGAGGQTVGLASATVHAPLHREQKLTGCGSKHVTRQLRQLAALNKFAVKIKRKLQTRNTNRTIDKLCQTAASWRHAFDIEFDLDLFLCTATAFAIHVVAAFCRPAAILHVRSRETSRCVGGRE